MIKKLDTKTLLKKMGILHFLDYTFLMLASLVPWLCHGMPHRMRSYAEPGNKWKSVGSGFPVANHWIAAGKPLPLDNLLIKLVKKWKFLCYLNYSSNEGFEK